MTRIEADEVEFVKKGKQQSTTLPKYLEHGYQLGVGMVFDGQNEKEMEE